MKQTITSDCFEESFNKATEEYEGEMASLDDHSKLTKISSEDIERELNVRLQNVTQISKSSIGLLFASIQILNDWHKLPEFELHLGDWSMHLSRLIPKLNQDSDFETDRLQAKTIKNRVLKLLLLIPSVEFNTVQKDRVLAIRGLVIIHALIENKPPGTQLIAGLTKLFAKKTEYENIADLNLTAIKEYVPINNQHDPEPFLYTLQKLFIKPWGDLENLVSPKGVHLIQINQSSKDGQTVKQEFLEVLNNIKDEDEQKYKTDLINYITYVQQFLGEKQNVGIIERYDYVQKFEIEIIVPEIVEDLKDINLCKLALATLLTLLLHCRPKRFRLIALKSNPETTAWLNIPAGNFCWSLSALTKRNMKDHENNSSVCIPLPIEIVSSLRRLSHQHQETPKSLGDLFNCDMTIFDAECKQYLRGKSLTSHRATLSRLEASYSRYVQAHTNDEVYIAAIGLDFCIGTISNFNYCVIRGNKLTQVLQNVYKKLGFSEQLLVSPKDLGSNVGLNYEKVWELAETLSIRAQNIISNVPKNLTFKNIVETHNDLALTIGSLLVIFTGHRAAESYTFSPHTVDLESELCIICDKRVTDYQMVRLVPFPSFISHWLDLYFRWLESLKYRLSSVNKQLAFQVENAINSTYAQSHPLFFTILNNKIEPFSSMDFSRVTKHLNLPTNCGRHFLDYVLRDGGLESAYIMALEGHSNLGQEAFGPSSLMSLIKFSDKTRDALDESIHKRNLALPPKFNPRQSDCSDLRFPRIHFTNLLNDKYEIKDKRSAQCPFSERSLEFMHELIKHSRDWQKTCGEINLNDLVYSLTLIDGVASQDELREVVIKILDGEIYSIDDCFFIDTVTKKLGVRRVWISFATVLIAATLAEAGDTNKLKLNFNNVEFKTICQSLIDSVASHYSVYAPGMLAAWARGEVCARTCRPETLARHHFNCPEKADFGFTESNRREVLLDDSLIRKAINRACDTSQNLGTNETRLKHLNAEIDQLLDFQIDEISALVLAKFTQYLISLQMAPSSISRYYTVVRQFLDYFLDEISELSQLGQMNWKEIVKNWLHGERLDTESGPETVAVNHFLTFVESDIKIKGSLYDLNSAVMEYADFPSQDEINDAFECIDNDPVLDEATKLKIKVMIGLLTQYALRPSEVRNIRVCDVYTGDPVHFVITSEAVGKLKTRNANRVLLLKDDQFSTKHNLLQLCHLKTELPSNAFLFGDSLDGSTLDGSQLLFNIVHDALSKVTGYNVSIMSFRHFNVTRDVNLAIENAGIDALKDRKILSIVAANSGHGHARTSLQNYCCDLDRQRYKFWEQHRSKQKLSVPIPEIKKRMDLDFKGNLPSNHSSFLLLMQKLKEKFLKTHVRIKNCQGFVLKKDHILASLAESNYKHFTAPYKYCFYKFASADSEVAVFESNILEHEKRIIDDGCSYLKDTLNKDWTNSEISRFRSIIQSSEFSKFVTKVGVMPIDDKDAIQIAHAINDLNKKWYIKNLKLLDLLERNLPIFIAANINVEISVNQNLQVNIRKLLRQKPFNQFSEKAMAQDVFCQISFWDANMKRSMRAKHHQQVMIKANLVFLTKAILVIGERHA